MPTQVLIVNVDVWDGRSDNVTKGVDVLVEGNLVRSIITKGIEAPNAHVVNGNGFNIMSMASTSLQVRLSIMARSALSDLICGPVRYPLASSRGGS